MSNNYGGGGGRNPGGGGGRSSRGGGGRGGYQGRNPRGGGGGRSRGGGRGPGGGGAGRAMFTPCRDFVNQGNCPNQGNCQFAHIVMLHKVFPATSDVPISPKYSNNYNNYNNHQQDTRKAAVSAVDIWEMNNSIQIFTGSQDGFWRLWNTAGGAFDKVAETNMKGKVQTLQIVQNSHLFYVGFEAPSKLLPDVPVGMVHVWNLQNASQPPLELQVESTHFPYAHNSIVTSMTIGGEGNQSSVVTGSRDGSIRLWTLEGGAFALVRTLPGHAREVTGLVLIPGGSLLWSSSTDGTIRIWDLSQAVPEKSCQYCITQDTPGQVPSSTTGGGGGNTKTGSGVGHTSAVTKLVVFASPAGNFVLSSSLDGTIKAWDANTGQCVANETHGEGVVTMALADPTAGQAQQQQQQQPQQPPDGGSGSDKKQVLLIGLESGAIACRNLVQTANAAAFQLLFMLNARYSAGHSGAVKAIAPGPAATFYTGGNDGNLMVWQFTGDLRI